MEKIKFFKACISEGLLPKGLRSKFNLAIGVNDVNLVENIQKHVDMCASRRLDLIYKYSQQEQEKLFNQYVETVQILSESVPQNVINREICQMKRTLGKHIHKKHVKLSNKV